MVKLSGISTNILPVLIMFGSLYDMWSISKYGFNIFKKNMGGKPFLKMGKKRIEKHFWAILFIVDTYLVFIETKTHSFFIFIREAQKYWL